MASEPLAFKLDQIAAWGRSFDEYVRMFSLTDSDLGKRFLGCGDGPASFNASMHTQGRAVVSVDPCTGFRPKKSGNESTGSIRP